MVRLHTDTCIIIFVFTCPTCIEKFENRSTFGVRMQFWELCYFGNLPVRRSLKDRLCGFQSNALNPMAFSLMRIRDDDDTSYEVYENH